jgi:hypothetical protein
MSGTLIGMSERRFGQRCHARDPTDQPFRRGEACQTGDYVAAQTVLL